MQKKSKEENVAKELAKALAEAQKEIKDVKRDAKGYGYTYASLENILKEVRPKFTKHGIGVVQTSHISDGTIGVKTTLIHESGDSLDIYVESPFEKLRGMNVYQSIGAAITYLRRYGISLAAGIASDEDIDTADRIGEADILEIESLLAQTNSDKTAFLKYFGVKSLEELDVRQIEEAKTILKRKLEKGVKNDRCGR